MTMSILSPQMFTKFPAPSPIHFMIYCFVATDRCERLSKKIELKEDHWRNMDFILPLLKFKRPKRDDDDDLDYIVGTAIVLITFIINYAYHVGFN
jgi:hypothetical protein